MNIMKRKAILLIPILVSSLFLSCEKENQSQSAHQEPLSTEAFNFSTLEEVSIKQNEFKNYIEKAEQELSEKFSSESSSELLSKDIFDQLKSFHENRLDLIYRLRKELDFVSIQSIADEINSLKVISLSDSIDLFEEYSEFLENFDGIVSTKENISFPDITNKNGDLFLNNHDINEVSTIDGEVINGKSAKVNALSYRNGFFTKDFTTSSGVKVQFVIEWRAGRTYHTDFFGIRKYGSYTKYISYVKIPNSASVLTTVPLPSTIFKPSSSSMALFSNETHPLLGEYWDVSFPSGSSSWVVENRGSRQTYATVNLWSGLNSSGVFYQTIGNTTVEIVGNHSEQF